MQTCLKLSPNYAVKENIEQMILIRNGHELLGLKNITIKRTERQGLSEYGQEEKLRPFPRDDRHRSATVPHSQIQLYPSTFSSCVGPLNHYRCLCFWYSAIKACIM